MSRQETCIKLLDQLMAISDTSAHQILRECDMTLSLIRKGPQRVPDDDELEHLESLLGEAISMLTSKPIEEGTVAFDGNGHLVQMNADSVIEYF